MMHVTTIEDLDIHVADHLPGRYTYHFTNKSNGLNCPVASDLLGFISAGMMAQAVENEAKRIDIPLDIFKQGLSYINLHYRMMP